MRLARHIAVVGSRVFANYAQLDRILKEHIQEGDVLVSGGAVGVDSMAQRWAKENGFSILIHYPDYKRFDSGATFIRNGKIVEDSEFVLAFYAKGRFQKGGTANSIKWAQESGKPFLELEEE